MDRAAGVRVTLTPRQGSRHPVQELGREPRRPPAAGLVHHPLAAGEVRLEAAAEDLQLLAGGLADPLLDQPEPLLVLCGALLVVLPHPLHAGGVSEVLGLVGTVPAEVLYHLDDAAVEHVEVVPLVTVQTPHYRIQREMLRQMTYLYINTCESVYTDEAVHQLGADGEELLLAGAPAQVLVVGQAGQGVGTPGHQAGGAVRHS